MEFKDYYKIMGLPRGASQEEIKRAYRKLARKYHPDVSKEPNAESKFKELGEAYEVLGDPEKRAAYDGIATGRRHGDRFTPPPDWNFDFDLGGGFREAGGFSDFFESLFGRATRGRRRPSPQSGFTGFAAAGQDQHAEITIGLEEAFSGGSQKITLGVPEMDPQGRLVATTRTLSVKIPKGVQAGQRVRLAGQGRLGSGGGPAGDLYLEVRFKPHRWFRPEGRNIVLDLPITPWEAALGVTLTVPTLAGRVELKIPPDSQAGRKLRLRGRGLPGDPPGDQYVILRIVTPPALTPEARNFYRKMAELMPMNPRAYLED
jgi:curved DNA-binding protein